MGYMLLQYFLIIFLSSGLTESLQVTVEGVIGGSTVLPCSSAEDDLKLQDMNVFWRHNNTEIVYEIIKGNASVQTQDQQYRNRVESFPNEYLRKNFSIKLNDLTHDDAGEFSCFITYSSEFIDQTVQLIINAEKGTKTTDWKKQEEAEADRGKTTRHFIITAVLLTIFTIIIIVCVIALIHKNKNSSDNSLAQTEQ